jgi:hypothetical protein
MSSSSASDRATRASRPPTSSSGPTRPKPATSTTRSKPPPKKPSDELAAHADATAPDLDPTITRVVHDPEVAARRSEAAARESEAAARESEAAARLTEHLHEATREIHIDSADLPVPRELAVRAAALVPRLERALGKEPTTRAILLTAMRLGLTSLEAQTDPDTWSDPEDPP